METSEFIDVEAFEQDKGIYYIDTLPRGLYELDGREINLSGYSEKIILDLDEEVKMFKITNSKLLDFYEDEKGVQVNIEEYKSKLKELCKNMDEDEYFSDLDEEYNYKKFKQNHKGIYKEVTNKIPVTFDIKHTIYDLPKHLTHTRKLNGNLKNTLYTYNEGLHIIDLVSEALIKKGFNGTKHESSLEDEFYIHSPNEYLRFSKISNQFLTIEIKDLKKYEERKVYKGSYQDVITRYNSNIKDINDIIDFWFLSKQKLEQKSIKDLYNELLSIKSELGSLEVKVKSSNKKRGLVNRLNKLTEDLKKSTLGDNKDEN